MRAKLFLLLIVSLSLLLSGCSSDESLENNQQHDGDDMNVIQNIGPQALDQMLRGLSVPVVAQQPSVTTVPSYSPSFVEQKNILQVPLVDDVVISQPSDSSSTVVIQQPIEPTTPSLVGQKYREGENDREGEDD